MDKRYRIKKILNNNVVLAASGFQEVIVVGLGIGHQAKVMQWVKDDKIEKVFVLEREDYVKTLQLVEEIPKDTFMNIYRIIDEIRQQSQLSLDEHAYITLIDHINFSIERLERGQVIKNFLLADLKILYPDEYRVGYQILERINKEFNIALPLDEAGFLTVHIVNGSDSAIKNQSSILTDSVLDCLNIVRDHYLTALKPEDLATQRIMIHIKMLIQRVMSSTQIDNKDIILYNVLTEFRSAYNCAEKIQNYIESRLKSTISSQEIVYLTIHINRIEQSLK